MKREGINNDTLPEYRRGYFDYWLDIPITNNPFAKNSWEFVEWECGYRYAAKEDNEENEQ